MVVDVFAEAGSFGISIEGNEVSEGIDVIEVDREVGGTKALVGGIAVVVGL